MFRLGCVVWDWGQGHPTVLGGYRIVDIETGAVLFNAILEGNRLFGSAAYFETKMDVSGWETSAKPSV